MVRIEIEVERKRELPSPDTLPKCSNSWTEVKEQEVNSGPTQEWLKVSLFGPSPLPPRGH